MNKGTVVSGVFSAVIFCIISAAFDVYVANITQSLNPAVFIVYCFILSTVVFLVISFLRGVRTYATKVQTNIFPLLLINIAVLLNWGGLIVSLKYLEPAVVGIASVACGPALTIVLARYLIKGSATPARLETIIAWVVLAGVIVMLINSYLGKSGIQSTSGLERAIGIVCVVFSAVGTVLYTFFSKGLSKSNWKSWEVLGFRNILMLVCALIYCSVSQVSLSLEGTLFLVVLLLSVIGHIIPIFLIQNSISILEPIHISLLLLLLPVFTLAFQFLDHRIYISWESISAVVLITVLLALLGLSKFMNRSKQER